MTRSPELGGTPLSSKPGVQGVKAIASAVTRIYSDGGLLAFWTGNGLSVAKIFPESAIKFLTYESSVSRIYFSDLVHKLNKIIGRNAHLRNTWTRSMIPEILAVQAGFFLAVLGGLLASSVSDHLTCESLSANINTGIYPMETLKVGACDFHVVSTT